MGSTLTAKSKKVTTEKQNITLSSQNSTSIETELNFFNSVSLFDFILSRILLQISKEYCIPKA